MNLLISACLLGISCRYDGRSKPCHSWTDCCNQAAIAVDVIYDGV